LKTQSLARTLIVGAGLGILLPALVLAAFLFTDRQEREINLRVRVPLSQYADVLARGMAVAIWNLDKEVAGQLVEAVMRNPDVAQVTVLDEYKERFAHGESSLRAIGDHLREQREVVYNRRVIGHVIIDMSTRRVQLGLLADLSELGLALLAQVAISFVLILLLFQRRMLQPLRALQQSTIRLARGDLDQPVLSQRHDEIGTLALGLDKMRTDLGTLIAERDSRNASLKQELAERLRAEEALRFSQAKFSAIFDASPVAMTVSRRQFGCEVASLNDAWVRLFERSRDQVIGTSGAQNGLWVSQLDRDAVLAEIDRAGEIARYPAWLSAGHAGKRLLCEVSGRSINLNDESLVILAYEDITAKYQYEREILDLNATLEHRVGQRTQELTKTLATLQQAHSELVRSEKLAALGALVAGIAHELNTPIGNCVTVASTMREHNEEFAGSLLQGVRRSTLQTYVERTREGTTILMRSLAKAAELVSSFKQVAVDQTSVNRRFFRLSDTVNEIMLTLSPMIRKTPHTVSCQIPPDLTMESYPGPLGQIITNLINNAFLHGFETGMRGSVTVSAEAIDNEWLQLSIEDNGSGIPQENLDRIFDPFFTTKLGQGGSGLGLSIVHNLVTGVLGGSIRVTSSTGGGTRISLTLPRTAPAGNQGQDTRLSP
jgi:PAS domain S-box-containing protein